MNKHKHSFHWRCPPAFAAWLTLYPLPLLINCCQHPRPQAREEASPQQVSTVSLDTHLPTEALWQEQLNLPPKLHIPASLLDVHEVSRPQAEMRAGPGRQYPLKDQLLALSTIVIVIARQGVWQKIIVPELELSGWVHHKALSPSKLLSPQVLPTSLLPMVRTIKAIAKIQSFPDLKELKVAIPNDTPFVRLKETQDNTLVWIPQTNALAWIKKKDLL